MKIKKYQALSIISLCAFILSVVLYFSRFFNYLENKAYDLRMNVTSSYVKPNEDICFIGVDQYSIDMVLEEFGYSWPWPREMYAQIIDFLNEGNAQSLVFDVLFTEPSVYGQEDDLQFAQSSKDFGKVVHVMFPSPDLQTALFPTKVIADSAAIFGNVTSTKDSDDVIRRARLFYDYEGKKYINLGLSPLFIDLNSEKEFDFQLDIALSNIPQLNDGSALLRYKGSIDRYAHYSAYDILKSYKEYKNGEESYFVPEDFENATVFFLLYAPGLFDICSTSVSQVYPGAGVHITTLDNYLSDDFIVKIPASLTFLLCFFLSALSMILILLNEKSTRKYKNFTMVGVSIFIPIIVISISTLLFAKSIFVPLVAPIFAYIISFVSNLIFIYSTENKQRRYIKSAFSQYLSKDVIEKLISNPDELKLGGQKRHITIFFSDIQSFTTVSESLSPEKLTEVLNKYLTIMTNIIIESGGTIDKYEGDAIIAFWNAPSNVENHAKVAIEASLKCQKTISQMQDEFMKITNRPLLTRIGINTGDAIVGNMGSSLRFDYTMLGDSVNLASRLEGINKQFGTYLMCSQTTKDEICEVSDDFYFRELAKVKVVGKNIPVTVYEPLTKEDAQNNMETLKIFDKGLQLFYDAQIENAVDVWKEISANDAPAKKYIEKCNELLSELKNGANKTAEKFNGIWVATSK